MQLPNLKRLALDFLVSRAGAYRRTFDPASRDARVVLADLARFCRATQSTAHPDSSMADQLEGRRQVWLRISEHLNLTTEELYDLYK